MSLNVGTGIQDESNQEFEQRNDISLDSLGAAFQLAKKDTILGDIGRTWDMYKASQVPMEKISPEDANQRFPMPTPFREDVHPLVAQKQFEAYQERRKLEERVAKGPQDLYARAKQFGVGMVAHLMDPVEFGVGMLTGWGVGAIIGRSAIGASLAARAATSVGARTALSAVESVSGNAIAGGVNEALTAQADIKQGQEYDPVQGLTNLTIGTFLGSIPHMAIKEIGFRANPAAFEGHLESAKAPREVNLDDLAQSRNKMILDTSPEADRSIVAATIGNLAEDKRPDITPTLTALAKETDVETPGYEYSPIVGAEDLSRKKLYVATREMTQDLANATDVPVGDDYGLGMHVTDNPGVANAAAARSMADSPGAVHEVEFTGEFKPLQLDGPVPENLKEQVMIGLKHIGEDPELVNSMSMKEVLSTFKDNELNDLLPQGAMQAFGNEIKKAGYNALVSDGSEFMGVPRDNAHNHITVLDESLVKGKSAQPADSSLVRRPTDQELGALQDKALGPKESMLVNKDVMDAEMKRLDVIKNAAQDDSQAFEKAMTELDETFNNMEKQGIMDESLRNEREQLMQARKDIEAMHVMRKAFMDCMGA